MEKFITLVGALAATAGAIAPMVTELNPMVGMVIAIVGVGLAAFGPGLAGPRGFGSVEKKSRARSNRAHSITIATAIGLSILSLACGAAKGILVIASGIEATVTVKRDLGLQGDMTPAGELQMTKTLHQADLVMIRVTDGAECFEVFTRDVKLGLLDSVDVTITSLEELNRVGALHIKSERGKKQFARIISGAKLSAIGVRVAVDNMRTVDPAAPSSELTAKERKALEEFRETCRRASVILKTQKTRLEEDLVRLGGSQI